MGPVMGGRGAYAASVAAEGGSGEGLGGGAPEADAGVVEPGVDLRGRTTGRGNCAMPQAREGPEDCEWGGQRRMKAHGLHAEHLVQRRLRQAHQLRLGVGRGVCAAATVSNSVVINLARTPTIRPGSFKRFGI